MTHEHDEWLARVADAARRAAQDLRQLDDPQHDALLADLDALYERLTGELRATGTDDS
jgi:hypothetical protein